MTSVKGETLTRSGPVAISVWEWVDGRTETNGLTSAQLSATGHALGLIHRTFAAHPATQSTPPDLTDWFHPDLPKTRATIDTLQDLIANRRPGDDFDAIAATTLEERRAALEQVPDLLAGLPDDLTTQVLHGDYSAVNLLFDGDDIAAVLDFRPPVPFLVSFELGRIAFDPRTVVLSQNWPVSAVTLVHAYRDAHPDAARQDVRACARVALIQLVTSLYGVKQHYLAPGLLQDDLDAFWVLRHRAATRLLDRLPEVEAMLDDATASTSQP
nr:phosphotransferase [Nocardiopsis sp. CNR-923]